MSDRSSYHYLPRDSVKSFNLEEKTLQGIQRLSELSENIMEQLAHWEKYFSDFECSMKETFNTTTTTDNEPNTADMAAEQQDTVKLSPLEEEKLKCLQSIIDAGLTLEPKEGPADFSVSCTEPECKKCLLWLFVMSHNDKSVKQETEETTPTHQDQKENEAQQPTEGMEQTETKPEAENKHQQRAEEDVTQSAEKARET